MPSRMFHIKEWKMVVGDVRSPREIYNQDYVTASKNYKKDDKNYFAICRFSVQDDPHYLFFYTSDYANRENLFDETIKLVKGDNIQEIKRQISFLLLKSNEPTVRDVHNYLTRKEE